MLFSKYVVHWLFNQIFYQFNRNLLFVNHQFDTIMMTKNQQFWRSLFLFVFAIPSFLFFFTSCMTEIGNITETQLALSDEGEIVFEKNAASRTIEVTCNRDWKVAKGADSDWIVVSPKSGKEETTILTIDVKRNDGVAREGYLIITASTMERTIIIKQNGEDIPEVVPATIKEIRTMYASKGEDEWIIAEPLKLKGIVISDWAGGNRPSQRDGFIQDQAGDGLAFRVTQSTHSYEMGDELSINLEGATVLYYGGILQINFSTKSAKVERQNVAVTPKQLTIEEVLNGDCDGILVKIKDVQFESYKDLKFYDKGNATNRTLENCGGANIIVKTAKYASFIDEPLPAGKGSIIGVVSLNSGVWQVAIRNLDDVKGMSNDASTRCVSAFIVTDKDALTFGNEGGNEAINITANVDWKATSDASWLTIAPESGSSDGVATIFVTENEGAERKAKITITEGTINKTVEVTQKAKEVSSVEATDLFFSEYVEGSSNNKYLEIYNGTGATVDLSDYKIELYVNGQTNVKTTEILSGTLGNGKVVVFKHSKAAIYDGEATISNAINHNGNDAFALVKISTGAYVDIFGRIGEDPGKAWTTSIIEIYKTTMDRTLVRKASVRGGVTVNPKKGFPTLRSEWIEYPIDTADFLGSHTMN